MDYLKLFMYTLLFLTIFFFSAPILKIIFDAIQEGQATREKEKRMAAAAAAKKEADERRKAEKEAEAAAKKEEAEKRKAEKEAKAAAAHAVKVARAQELADLAERRLKAEKELAAIRNKRPEIIPGAPAADPLPAANTPDKQVPMLSNETYPQWKPEDFASTILSA